MNCRQQLRSGHESWLCGLARHPYARAFVTLTYSPRHLARSGYTLKLRNPNAAQVFYKKIISRDISSVLKCLFSAPRKAGCFVVVILVRGFYHAHVLVFSQENFCPKKYYSRIVIAKRVLKGNGKTQKVDIISNSDTKRILKYMVGKRNLFRPSNEFDPDPDFFIWNKKRMKSLFPEVFRDNRGSDRAI